MPALGTPHDDFDRAMFERIAQLERLLSAATRERDTAQRDRTILLYALALREGRHLSRTAYTHLGRTLEDL